MDSIRNPNEIVKKNDSAKSDTVKMSARKGETAEKALPNRPDGEDGHIHPDAIDFSYFQTIFKVGDEYFEGIVNIKNNKRGKLLKDITKIKNITQDIVSSYGNNPKSNFLRDASMDSIRNPNEIVKENDSAKSDTVKLSARKGETAENALYHFGRTYSWKETGYLLTDGAKLDSSGRHEGASGGYRTVDHRDILDVYPEDTELNGNGVMVDYVFQGNIRIMPEGNGINMQVQPTKAQEQANGKFALLYANKKEALSLLRRAGHQLTGTLIPHDGFYHSIREKASPVKPKFNYVTKTQQFRRWFGDWLKHPKTASKIVDTDGTPKVMYQGTTEPSLCPRVVAPRWTIQRLCIAFMLYIKKMVKFTS